MTVYEIYADSSLLWSSNVDERDLAILEPVLTMEINKAGQLTFRMPKTHRLYDSIQKMKTTISVRQDGVEIWEGRVLDDKGDFYNRKAITCEGALAYLNDSIQPQAEYHFTSVAAFRNFLISVLTNHNDSVLEDRRFTVGNVTMEYTGESYFRYTNFNNTLAEITEDLVNDFGGFLRVRRDSGVRYLDYLSSYGRVSGQAIRFGENLLDFSRNTNVADIATRVIPLGERLDEASIEALGQRLDIKSVNNGLNYIQSNDAVASYGIITKVVTWDGVTLPSELLRKGREWLSQNQWENMVLEVSAVDLHMLDSTIDSYRLGDSIHVISEPHGLNTYMMLSQMELHLADSSQNKITLGQERKERALSAQTSSLGSTVSAISSRSGGGSGSGGGSASIIIDSALDASSTNPVENRAIYQALNRYPRIGYHQGKLTLFTEE